MSAATGAPAGDSASEIDLTQHLQAESEHAALRRSRLFGGGTSPVQHDQYLEVPGATAPGTWALALSGGGIRSATFCLGVLQELALPTAKAYGGLPDEARAAAARVGGLLPQFDYVSSVSGGGFTAGFVQALYCHQPTAPDVAAAIVNSVLGEEPPGRVQAGVTPTPLAWLRENGRYLAPSGAGDMAYAFGFGLRNWLGIQCVIGAPFLLASAVLAGGARLLHGVRPDLQFAWWWLALAVFAAWVVPSAGAYWMTRDIADGKPAAALPGWRVACVLAAGVLATLCGTAPAWLDALCERLYWPFAPVFGWFAGDSRWPLYLIVCGIILLLAVVWAVAVRYLGSVPKTKGDLAVALTRICSYGIQTTSALLVLTLVIELAQELLALNIDHPILLSGGGAGILTVGYHGLLKFLPKLRGAGSSLGNIRGLPRRTLWAALGLFGFVALVGVATFWAAAAQWLMLAGQALPSPVPPAKALTSYEALSAIDPAGAWTLGLLALVFVFVAGRWSSILNMSSYHHFYSSRLTRAYLGAANPQRTSAIAPPAGSENGIARFVAGDSIDYAAYYGSSAAPLHLINATLNQTVDPSEQLVQRDRKGKPFVVLPPLLGGQKLPFVDVAIDGKFVRTTGAGAQLTIGDWLAVSGAAVSTGMGRQTSPGAAICVTLANLRIGRWWDGNGGADGLVRHLFPTYPYLVDELLGRFHGTQCKRAYLTDGGHFDNTAVYELLRRVRNPHTAVRFILLCDCGADHEYRYDDLANLVRLARVDFQLEIEVDEHAASNDPLCAVFGTPATMRAADPAHLNTRCAILLNVRDRGTVVARIVLIKPRLIACVSNDLLGYYRNNPVFPQQTTGDQFFDDEQWESYRKLGVECCRVVLNLGPKLWQAVL